MSKEIITLRVPDKPKAEFVSHGNMGVELHRGEEITVDNRRFADWLVSEYELEIIDEKTVEDKPDDQQRPDDQAPDTAAIESGYPEDFPGRKALIAAEVPYETAVNLDAERLAEYEGIGPKTAAAIVEYAAAGTEGGTE